MGSAPVEADKTGIGAGVFVDVSVRVSVDFGVGFFETEMTGIWVGNCVGFGVGTDVT